MEGKIYHIRRSPTEQTIPPRTALQLDQPNETWILQQNVVLGTLLRLILHYAFKKNAVSVFYDKRLKKKKRDCLSYSTTVQPTDCSSANTQGGFLVDMVMARTALCRMRYFQGRKKKEILRICFSHVGFRKDCLWTVCVVMAVVPISLFTVSGHRVVGLPGKRQAGLKEGLFYFRCEIAPAL